MPTTNISVTSTWTQIATNTNNELLATWDTPVIVEFAATSANSAPTVLGHKLSNQEGITRSVIGSGYVWAKLPNNSVPASINMIVSK